MRTLLLFLLLLIAVILPADAQTAPDPALQSFVPANNGLSISEVTDASNNAFFLLGKKNGKQVIALYDGLMNKWYDIPLPFPGAEVLEIIHHQFVTVVALVRTESNGTALYHWRRNKWVTLSASELNGEIRSIKAVGIVDFLAIGDFNTRKENYRYAKFFDGKWEKHTLENASEQAKDLMVNGRPERVFIFHHYYAGLIVLDPRSDKRYLIAHIRNWEVIGNALPGPVKDIFSGRGKTNTYISGDEQGSGKPYLVRDSAEVWTPIDLTGAPIFSVQKIISIADEGDAVFVNGIFTNGDQYVGARYSKGKWSGGSRGPGIIVGSTKHWGGFFLILDINSSERFLVQPPNKQNPLVYMVIPDKMETPTADVLSMRSAAKK